MKLGGEEVGEAEYEQTIFDVLFKSSNNEKENKLHHYIGQKHRIHLKVGCDERFSNYIYKSIIKGKKVILKVHKNKKFFKRP